MGRMLKLTFVRTEYWSAPKTFVLPPVPQDGPEHAV
jgi:hypothetical protein